MNKRLENSKGKSLKEKIALQRELEIKHMQLMKDVYSHYENGTFMSIDIVGSTRLKDGVDSVIVVDSFQSFHQFIKECIDGCISNVFSGDGIMCLYKNAQEAVDTALKILSGLENFNIQYSGLNGYMNIRVGINTGAILLGETRELGHLTERSIDIAGHLQKYGTPGQLLISESTLKNINNKNEFIKWRRKIDNTVVYNHSENFTPINERYSGSPIRMYFVKMQKSLKNISINLNKELKQKIFFITLGLIVLLASIKIFNNKKNNNPEIGHNKSSSRQRANNFKNKPIIIKNKISKLGKGQALSSVKIKINGKWNNLPATIYLIIPQGLNTEFNGRNGIKEIEIIPLKKNNSGKYYYMHWRFMERKVEIKNNYYVFINRSKAEKKLKILLKGVRK